MAKAKKKSAKKQNKFGAYIIYMWLLAAGAVLFGIAMIILVAYSKLPDISKLENPKYEYASIAYDFNMKELGKIFKYNRTWVTFDQIPKHTVDALISTEDIRYYKHSGIDVRGTLRAVAYLGKKGGASTITQQLAKQFFTKRSRNFIVRIWQKLQEWVLAIELEKRYTKEEIIAMYLNKYEYIYNSFGIESAAQTYFGKSQKDLSLEESAVLIGMLKSAIIYNPKMNPENSFKRRNLVLHQMKKYGFIDEATYELTIKKPLDISEFNPKTHYTGQAPYFRAELNKWLKELLSKKEYRKVDGTEYNIFLDGLKIYTTIDIDYQIKAEKAVQERMKSLQAMFDRVWEGKDPWTYGANKDQLKSRNASLNRSIKESDRFNNIRNHVMHELIDSVKKEFPDARMWDADIHRMLMAKKDAKYFDKMLKKDFVNKSQVRRYAKIMASRHWTTIIEKQKELNQLVKKSFNKKVKMKIFDFERGEKNAWITPLDSIKFHRSRLQTGMLAIEPSTGHVKAWVGGINFKRFQFDHINSRRQVGSTFKPFVYTTAIFNQGISPCFKVQDKQYSITPGESSFGLMKTWSPSNSDGKFSGEFINLKEGLLHSVNSVSVYLMKELGNVDNVRKLVHKFGIDKDLIPKSPSICLGASDLSVMEMTAAYSVFANNGFYNKPTFVTRIEDKNGKLIYQANPDQHKVLPENYNYVMLDMLQYAGRIIQPRIKSAVGGKTGTTNDYRDGWFMGVTPNLVVGTWVGGEDQWIRFRSIREGQGGVMARPIFVKFMESLEADKNIDFTIVPEFKAPEGELGITIDCDSYDALNYQDQNENSDNPIEILDEFEEEL